MTRSFLGVKKEGSVMYNHFQLKKFVLVWV